jgi:hypothetical protein
MGRRVGPGEPFGQAAKHGITSDSDPVPCNAVRAEPVEANLESLTGDRGRAAKADTRGTSDCRKRTAPRPLGPWPILAHRSVGQFG